jgi:hypothetical protein
MTPVALRTRLKEKFILTLIISICTLFHACKKDTDQPNPPKHDPPYEYYTRNVKVKDVNIERLPSPFFHFEYDPFGLAKRIDFASGFYVYDLKYDDRKLLKMTNIINNNTLEYTWTADKVTDIRERRTSGVQLWHYVFMYNADNQVREIRWYQMGPNANDSLLARKVVLAYGSDGNLSRYDDYRNSSGTPGPVEWSHAEEFSNFDDGVNVDDIGIMKDFFDHVLFLPNIRFQVNNPQNVRYTSVQNDYDISYDWTYNNKLPVSKRTTFLQTRGTDAGRTIVGSTNYSYY